VGMLSRRQVDAGEKRRPGLGEGGPSVRDGVSSDQAHKAQDGQERTMSVWKRQEIQEVLWCMTGGACPHKALSARRAPSDACVDGSNRVGPAEH